jgi:hypothetical protein
MGSAPRFLSLAVAPAVRCVLAATAWLLDAPTATASEPERVRLAYHAASGCVPEDGFLAMVAGDGGHLVLSEDDTASSRLFDVTMTGTGPFAGRLAIRNNTGAEAVRLIAGDRCEGVARALALLVTLALEDTPTSDPELPSVTPPEPIPPAPTPPAATPEPADLAVPEEPTPSSEPREPNIDPQPQRWRLALSAGAGFGRETGPVLQPNVAGYMELFDNGRKWFSPSIRLGIEKDADWELDEQVMVPVAGYQLVHDTSLSVKKTTARLDACPLRWIAAQPWADDMLTAQPCARVDAGQLELQPYDKSNVKRPWVAVGTLLRVRWLLPRVFFEAEVGAMFPLTAGHYVVATTPYDVSSAAAAVVSLGFGVLIL